MVRGKGLASWHNVGQYRNQVALQLTRIVFTPKNSRQAIEGRGTTDGGVVNNELGAVLCRKRAVEWEVSQVNYQRPP